MATSKHEEDSSSMTSPGSPAHSEDLWVTDSDASIDLEDRVAVPIDKRCKYPSKLCCRARARKSNGTFHRFCQYHRIKANANQKRWTSVRRQQAAQEDKQRRRAEAFAAVHQSTMYPMHLGEMTMSGWWTPELLPDPVNLNQVAEPVGLPLEDVQILNALLTGDEPHTIYPSTCQRTTQQNEHRYYNSTS